MEAMEKLLASRLYVGTGRRGAQTFQQMIVPVNIESARKFYPTNDELIEEEQWAKLKLVKEIAEEVWG